MTASPQLLPPFPPTSIIPASDGIQPTHGGEERRASHKSVIVCRFAPEPDTRLRHRTLISGHKTPLASRRCLCE